MEVVDLTPNISKKYTGFSYGELLSLAGYFAIPQKTDDAKFHERIEYHYDVEDIHDGIVYVEFANFLINILEVKIDLRDKTIYNSLIKARRNQEAINAGGGIGLGMLVSQINAARELGFTHLTLTAWGGNKNWHLIKHVDRRKMRGFIGYILWGKTGYSLSTKCQGRLYRFANRWGTKNRSIYKMLLDESDYKIWKRHGGHWHGIFDVNPQSVNVKRLREYIERKGSDYNV